MRVSLQVLLTHLTHAVHKQNGNDTDIKCSPAESGAHAFGPLTFDLKFPAYHFCGVIIEYFGLFWEQVEILISG